VDRSRGRSRSREKSRSRSRMKEGEELQQLRLLPAHHHLLLVTHHGALQKGCPMDEGTLKIPIPKCRLFWSFLFRVV
jgi:hypothetical protein